MISVHLSYLDFWSFKVKIKDMIKRKNIRKSSNANINFTIRQITNVNVNTYSASRKLLYTSIWTKQNIQI